MVQATAQFTVVDIKDGISSLSVILSNENQVLQGDSSGEVHDLSEAKTDISVYYGTNDITSLCTITKSDSGLSGSLLNGSYKVDSLNTTTTGYADITITYGELSVTKRFNVTIAKAGASGTGKNIKVVASSQVFKSADGTTYTPDTIVLTPRFQDTIFSNWQYSTNGSTWTTIDETTNGCVIGTGSTLTISNSTTLFTESVSSISFRCNTDDETIYDVLSVFRLSDAGSVDLSNYDTKAEVDEKLAGKNTIFTSQPIPPYYVGNVWIVNSGGDVGIIRTSTVDRLTGSFVDADWTKPEPLYTTVSQITTVFGQTLDGFNSEATNLTTRFNNITSSITGINETTSSLTQKSDSLTASVTTLREDLDVNTGEIEAANNTISQIQVNVGDITSTVSQTNETLDGISTSVSNLQQTSDGLALSIKSGGDNLLLGTGLFTLQGISPSKYKIIKTDNLQVIELYNGSVYQDEPTYLYVTNDVGIYSEGDAFIGGGTTPSTVRIPMEPTTLTPKEVEVLSYNTNFSIDTNDYIDTYYLSRKALSLDVWTSGLIKNPIMSDYAYFSLKPFTPIYGNDILNFSFKYINNLNCAIMKVIVAFYYSYAYVDPETTNVTYYSNVLYEHIIYLSEGLRTGYGDYVESIDMNVIRQEIRTLHEIDPRDPHFHIDSVSFILRGDNHTFSSTKTVDPTSSDVVSIPTSWANTTNNVVWTSRFKKDSNGEWVFDKWLQISESVTDCQYNSSYSYLTYGVLIDPCAKVSGSFYIGDVKLKYGEYSDWSLNSNELQQINYYMGERGFQIKKNNHEMYIDEDEIKAYYKNIQIFGLDRDSVFSKTSKTEKIENVNRVTEMVNVDSKEIYITYIK